MARTYCSTCHLFPEPDLLPRSVWLERVLPEMGLRMGIGDRHVVLERMSFGQFDDLCRKGIYPEAALLEYSDWRKIEAYYREESPETLKPDTGVKISTVTVNPFSIQTVMQPAGKAPNVTMVRFMKSTGDIWVGNGDNELTIYDIALNKRRTIVNIGPIVDVSDRDGPVLLSIGKLHPSEDRKGSLYRLDMQSGRSSVMTDSLHRPVEFKLADMDSDGFEDMVIAEFGFETGGLTLRDGESGKMTTIYNQPGARSIVLADINHDGLTDMYVLFAQGREEVVRFINKGGFNFEAKSMLQFSSVYGNSHLNVRDMNNDGFEDIVLANGDNADYSSVPKPYHGIRIFTNDGRSDFKQTFFHPVSGATKSLVEDFDGDGDVDIALASFFNEAGDDESFLYFQQESDGSYSKSKPAIPKGNWLVMEAADVDVDGDLDILLGNFQLYKASSGGSVEKVQIALMRNVSKNK